LQTPPQDAIHLTLEKKSHHNEDIPKESNKKEDRQTHEKIKGSTERNYRRRTKDQMPSLEMRS